jgi:uncharacterized membrane protein
MNAEPLFSDLIGVMAVITMIPVFFLWLEKKTRWRIFNVLPAIIWIFLTPILLSNLNVIPKSTPIYSTFRAFAVPMFIVLMLLDINIRETMKVAWRGAAVLTMGSVGVVIGCVVAFFFFRGSLPPDSWSGFGALAGSWIGGTGNLAAVAESLDTPEAMVGIVVIVDNFVYLAYFPLILTCKRWAAPFNRWTGVSQAEIDHITEAVAGVEKKSHEVHFKDLVTLVGFAFTAILVANTIAGFLPELRPVLTVRTWAILLVTTIGVALSATPLKKVPGTEPMAMMLVCEAVPDGREHGGGVERLGGGGRGVGAGGGRLPPGGTGPRLDHAGANRLRARQLPGGGDSLPEQPLDVAAPQPEDRQPGAGGCPPRDPTQTPRSP